MSELQPPRKVADMDLSLFGDSHVRAYRETNGATGYLWNAAPILLLTTKGRKSGDERTSPLIFVRAGDEVAIIASKGGAPQHPGWFLNIEGDPSVTVQVKDDVYEAKARVAEGAERTRIWEDAVKVWPQYADYQASTDRKIPVVVLERKRG